ncbi:hypothetical protein BGW41_000467 [Actinomortierella wolfii]|nr:hypothetical protein BGW41_000467 [Actinomortierella wolfii]
MTVDLEKGIDSTETFSPPETGSFLAYRDDVSGSKNMSGATRTSGGLFASVHQLYLRNPSTVVRGRYSISFRQIVSITGLVLGMLVVWTYIGTRNMGSGNIPADLEQSLLDANGRQVKSPQGSHDTFIYPTFVPQPGDPPTARERWERVRGKGTRSSLKAIQYVFPPETEAQRTVREERLKAVREGFLHAWNGYKEYAWGHDEVYPIRGMPKDNFGGWGATMIDSLDTLLIMGLNKEFDEALEWVKTKFDMTKNPTEQLQFFETVIRYLGGLLSAYDLSGETVLLEKARELGDIMLNAFKGGDFPASRVSVDIAHQPSSAMYALAEIGTIQLEFTRLSRLTGNPIYETKARKIIDILGSQTSEIKGLLPELVTPGKRHYTHFRAHVAGMTDSYYEYLLKEWILLDGKEPKYREMFEESMDSLEEYMVSRPSDGSQEYAIVGKVETSTKNIETTMDHLACFIGGSLAMGSVYFDRPKDMVLARQITEACYLSYHYSATGLGPENFKFQATSGTNGKSFDPRLPGTFYERSWSNQEYILRPETLESLWIMYRLTGNPRYQDQAWEIFQALEKSCRTKIAYSALSNVNVPGSYKNGMESFFLAETMKYLYLMFSTPDVISLDDFVLNTEAHPLRRM